MKKIEIFITDSIDTVLGQNCVIVDLSLIRELGDNITDHVIAIAKMCVGYDGDRNLVVCSKRLSSFVAIEDQKAAYMRMRNWLPSIFTYYWSRESSELFEVTFHNAN